MTSYPPRARTGDALDLFDMTQAEADAIWNRAVVEATWCQSSAEVEAYAVRGCDGKPYDVLGFEVSDPTGGDGLWAMVQADIIVRLNHPAWVAANLRAVRASVPIWPNSGHLLKQKVGLSPDEAFALALEALRALREMDAEST